MAGKLVRDTVPDLIRREGRRPVVRQLAGTELTSALLAKLYEEVGELAAATTSDERIEELADVVEVISSIEAHLGIAAQDVEAKRLDKRRERGGFDAALWLEG